MLGLGRLLVGLGGIGLFGYCVGGCGLGVRERWCFGWCGEFLVELAEVLGKDAGGWDAEVVEGDLGLVGLVEVEVALGECEGDEGEVGVGVL